MSSIVIPQIAMLQQAYSNMNEELRQGLNVWVLSNLPK